MPTREDLLNSCYVAALCIRSPCRNSAINVTAVNLETIWKAEFVSGPARADYKTWEWQFFGGSIFPLELGNHLSHAL